MVNPRVAELLVAAFVCNARIEGMKARNAHCISNGQPPTYSERPFFEEAEELGIIRSELRSCSQS